LAGRTGALDFTLPPDADESDETPSERQARLFEEMQRLHRQKHRTLADAVDTRTILYMTMALFVGLFVFSILRWLDGR
jgi:hypothetical protein